MSRLGQTPSQTVGPYYSMRLAAPGQNVLVPEGAAGRIRIEGRVLDGDGKPIEDALLEIWQADQTGRYRHPADDRSADADGSGFTGFGRASVEFATGAFWFDTVKPGRVAAPDGSTQAPHIGLIVQARGMLAPSFTRIYFADEAEANGRDFVLALVPGDRRSTLIATVVPDAPVPTYRFDVQFQGADETVFFDF